MENFEADILKAIGEGSFFDFVYEASLEEFQQEDRNLASQLAYIHNEGKINLVSEFSKLDKTEEPHDFFMLRAVFEKALPQLNAPVEDVIPCVRHLILEAGNDMTAYILIGPFREYCQKDITRPRQAIELSVSAIDENLDFITPSIEAGSKLDLGEFLNKAVELTKHSVSLIVQRAVFSLGRIDYLGEQELIEQSYSAIIEASSQHPSDLVLAGALKSLFALTLQRASMEERMVAFIEKQTSSPEDQVIHAASEILFYDKRKSSEAIEDALLELITNVKAENTGTINNLDLALADLIKRDRYDKVIEVIESIIDKTDSKIKLNAFDSVERELLEHKDTYLSHLFTRWFLSGKVAYGRCCIDLLTDTPDKGIELSFDLSQLSGDFAQHHTFLARKACGWLFVRPISAISLIVSLLDTCPKEQIDGILNISFQPLLISYPGSVKDYLEKVSQNSTSKKIEFCSKLLSRLGEFHERLRGADKVKELRPSEESRFIYLRHQNRVMNRSMKESEKAFPLSSLVDKHILLYGQKSINYIQNGNKKIRTITPMTTTSHSIEYPFLQLIDPNNLNYQLLTFRLEGCTK